jgi:hypothetical protein
MPASRFSANAPGPKGTTVSTTMAGTSMTPGASPNTHLSAAAGTMFSFWRNLIPSATSWPTPCGNASIGPSLDCMWASTLCSM